MLAEQRERKSRCKGPYHLHKDETISFERGRENQDIWKYVYISHYQTWTPAPWDCANSAYAKVNDFKKLEVLVNRERHLLKCSVQGTKCPPGRGGCWGRSNFSDSPASRWSKGQRRD